MGANNDNVNMLMFNMSTVQQFVNTLNMPITTKYTGQLKQILRVTFM